MTRVILHLDRVVLSGLRVDDLPAFTAGLERELARTFRLPGALDGLPRGASAGRVRRGEIRLPRELRADRIGRQVARGVAGALRA
jgi:hypothetical protein